MLTKKSNKWIMIVLISLCTITALRLVWLHFLTTFDYDEKPMVTEGMLDLRGWEFSTYKTLQLDGEWEFYLNEFVDDQASGQHHYIQVPSYWERELDLHQPKQDAFSFGTYRLRILLDEENEHTFALRINKIKNASAIYANGELVAQTGKPADNLTDHRAKNIPYTAILTPEEGQINLVIHVSNHAGESGIMQNIRFGTVEAIQNRNILSVGLQLLLSVLLIIHSLYAIILYFLGSKSKGLLYFSLIMVFGILSVWTADDRLLFAWFNIDYIWTVKITFFTYIGVVAFMPALFHHLFPTYLPKKLLYGYSLSIWMYVFFILFASVQTILATGRLLGIVMIVSACISAYILWRAIRDKKDVIYLLLASLFVGVNIIWSVTVNSSASESESIHYPFDLIFALLAFATFWFRRFFQATEKTKQLTEKLQEEDKRKDEFLVNTSHELRNPLHGMMNLTQAMLDDQKEPLPIEQRNRLELQMHISKHLSLLIEDLLDITRLKENTIQLNWQTVSLHSVITGVNDMIKIALGEKCVTLKVEIDENFPLLWGDEQRLIQILFNLLHNAVKFTNEGTITTRAKVKNGWAHIQVEDTGIGIAQRDIDHIFKAYEQGETLTDNAEGLGLGLNICQKLVTLHDGTIHAESTLGNGSIFTFTFPIANDKNKTQTSNVTKQEIEQNHVQSFKEVSATTTTEVVNNFELEMNEWTTYSPTEKEQHDNDWRDNQPSKLLVVDDDYVNLNIIRTLLETEQYEVMTANDADTALTILKEVPTDLVISDVMMPNISGYELTRRIREHYSIVELPVLLLTARARSQDIVTGFQVGANDYLTKPVDALELKARVRALTRLKIALEEHVRMEGAWLQSQIQPHFLFNTLNSIAALGIIDYPKMQALLEEFSNYLRLSFDFKNADPVVSLEHELALVRSYIYIEQERFDDRIQVDWDIEPSLNIFIPPLSIQPLVENAIKHGLLRRSSGGTIRIQIKKEAAYYEITISDDGIGMTEKEIEVLFKKQEVELSSPSTRVGLRNINRRLKQLYNEGLIVDSKHNVGTTVRFRIPHHLASKQ